MLAEVKRPGVVSQADFLTLSPSGTTAITSVEGLPGIATLSPKWDGQFVYSSKTRQTCKFAMPDHVRGQDLDPCQLGAHCCALLLQFSHAGLQVSGGATHSAAKQRAQALQGHV